MKVVELTQGQVTLVDDEDYQRVIQFNWQAHHPGENSSWRAKRGVYDPATKNNKNEYLHNFIMQQAGVRFDHKDGDGLNNQKENLRPATQRQNSWAYRRKAKNKTSKFRGVFWFTMSSGHSYWYAKIEFKGKRINLGLFHSEEEAARAYDTAAVKMFGEFASPNFKSLV